MKDNCASLLEKKINNNCVCKEWKYLEKKIFQETILFNLFNLLYLYFLIFSVVRSHFK